ncbi:MAG TPA: hypothetical protein PLV42_02660 [bacterium]|nr:hypothetical protein [bacterium]
MQGLTALFLILAPLLCLAGEEAEEAEEEVAALSFGGSVALGGGYESDVARSQGVVGGRLGAADLLVDAQGEMTLFEEASFGASFLYDLLPAYDGRYTRMALEATADWYRDLGPVELDLGGAGGLSLIDRFAPEPYFGSFDSYAELVIPHGETLEWLVTLTAAYQHGLRADVSYLRGPDFFLQGAVRWYFDDDAGTLGGGYRAGVSLREEAGLYDIAGLAESGYIALTACNEHFEQALFAKVSYVAQRFSVIGRFSAIHRYAFAKDRGATLAALKEKRRIEFVVAPSAEFRFALTDSFDLSAEYAFEYTISSLGKGDYYDMNGPRHTARVLATQRF